MALTELQITHVRNLRQARLEGLGRVNVLYGANGSGKTSILEAAHLLGMARSFRGNSVKSVITHGEDTCTVFGKITRGKGKPSIPLGVQRQRSGEAQIHVSGKAVRAVAQLAEQLPLQVMTAGSFALLTGPPAARRQFLDWGVFHVEQRFFPHWQRFQRCIKQRNILLRRGKITDPQELAVWTRDLASTGAAIDRLRLTYFEKLDPLFQEIAAQLAPSLGSLEIQYRRGWDAQQNYAAVLDQGLKGDLEQGYTHSGPQRADLRVKTGGHLAADTLSRGQQKLVIAALKLAQGELMSQQGCGQCTYLIDDLPSELDEEHGHLVCEKLAAMRAQVFITCVDAQEMQSVWPAGEEFDMFHVEQGTVQRA